MTNRDHETYPTGTELHEEKHMSTALITDNGKVFTPDGEGTGEGILRYLDWEDIVENRYTISLTIPMQVGQLYAFPAPLEGEVQGLYTVLDSSINATTTITVLTGGISRGIVTINNGGGAGTVDSNAFLSPHFVSPSSYISINNNGTSTSSGNITVLLDIEADTVL